MPTHEDDQKSDSPGSPKEDALDARFGLTSGVIHATTPKIRVRIDDDRVIVREALGELLASTGWAEVSVPTGPAEDRIDVTLVGVNGLDAAAPRSGRQRFLSDDEDVNDLVDEILRPARGADETPEKPYGLPGLTAREQEVVDGLVRGLGAEAIAATLGIARKSVENHKHRIYVKLGVHNQTEVIMAATRSGMPSLRGSSIVVADGSRLIASAVASVLRLRPGHDVRIATTFEDLSRSVCQQPPSLVVTSVALAGRGELGAMMKNVLTSGGRVLLLGDPSMDTDLASLLLDGASGCLPLADLSSAMIVSGVTEVLRGHAALHPAIAGLILRQWRTARVDAPDQGQAHEQTEVSLTVREMDVLHGMSRGLPTKAVARQLGVSPKTVEAHTTRILSKLGVPTRAKAVSVALSRGLLTESG